MFSSVVDYMINKMHMFGDYTKRYFYLCDKMSSFLMCKGATPTKDRMQEMICDEVRFRKEMQDKYGE